MTTLTLRKELHKAIDSIEDSKFLEAVYTIINEKTQEEEYGLSSDQWKEIDYRVTLHNAGKSKSYTVEETMKHVKSRLKK